MCNSCPPIKPSPSPTTKRGVEANPDAPPISFNLGGIPQFMRRYDQWVSWRWEWSDVRACQAKILKYEDWSTGHPKLRNAKSNDSETWTSYENVAGLVILMEELCPDRPPAFGIGFVISKDDPLAAIDLDDCRDPTTGVIAEWAWKRIRQVNSYTEVSPSGTGVKIFLLGAKPGIRCHRKDSEQSIEIYDRLRFCAMTGQHVPGTPAEPMSRQAELDAIYHELFPPQPAAQRIAEVTAALPLDLSDQDIIDRAAGAGNGAKFSALWRGDWSGYESRSDADMALASLLAFWTGPDASRIVNLMRQSGLRREKWEKRPEYLSGTVKKVVAGLSTWVGCRRHSVLSHPAGGQEQNGADMVTNDEPSFAADIGISQWDVWTLLDGLSLPPPAAACPRGGSGQYANRKYRNRKKVCRYGCDCWHCRICRKRLATSWALDSAAWLLRDRANDWTFSTIETTAEQWSKSLRDLLRRRGGGGAILESNPGRFHVIISLPPGAEPVPGAEPTTPEDLGAWLVGWVRHVRTWDRQLSRKRTYPARFFGHWFRLKDEPLGDWCYTGPVLAKDPETILAILADFDVRVISANAYAATYCASPDSSLVWEIQYDVPPGVDAAALHEALSLADDPMRGRREAQGESGEEPIPW